MKTIRIAVEGVKFTLRARRGHWVADLRAAGFARHALKVAAPGNEVQAGFAARALLDKLRAPKQLSLDVKPRTVADAVRDCLRAARFRTEGTREWASESSACVIKELGAVAVTALQPPGGNELLRNYRDGLRDAGLSAHTVLGRYTNLRRALLFEIEEGRLHGLPKFPKPNHDGEVTYKPTCRPVSQAHYLLVHGNLLPMYRSHARYADKLARRLLYLDFVRYTGAHAHDADTLAGEHVSHEFGTFLRRNLKAAGRVDPVWLEMPEQLATAMRAEYERRGGYIAADELVCGKWKNAAREIAVTCQRLQIPSFDLLDLRCTVATELAMAGVQERVAVSLLGHTTSKMVREVYTRIPRAELSTGLRKIGTSKGPAPSRIAPVLRLAGPNTGDAEARKGNADPEK